MHYAAQPSIHLSMNGAGSDCSRIKEEIMEKPDIEEQLKAIEAAIDLAQAKNLPVVVKPAQPAIMSENSNGHDPSKVRDLALMIFKKFDERIASIEQEEMAQREEQSYTAVVQQEHHEALEYISDEVAALKKRSAQIEGLMRHLQVVKPSVDLFHTEQREWRQGYKFMGVIIGVLILLLGLLLIANIH